MYDAMKLTDHDLKQITEYKLEQLTLEQLLSLSKKMFMDLVDSRDRLNQNSNNSSKPPSSAPPWASNPAEQESTDPEDGDDEDSILNEPPSENDDLISPEDGPTSNTETVTPDLSSTSSPKKEEGAASLTPMDPPVKRNAGKQLGAEGFGRTQELAITEIIYHAKIHCALCDACLGGHEEQTAWTGFYTIDIAEYIEGNAGIILTNTKHIFFETECECGHHNREEPYGAMPDVTWPKTDLAEWRLVGPRLAAMIVLLSKRHRNSCRLIREFLLNFLRLELSVGTISQTIREAGRSVSPLEEELIRDLEAAALAYVDETSWKEAGVLRWLWVFRTLTVVFFMVGKRDHTIFSKLLLNSKFKGIVMSDGWVVYREYVNRLRCWAHLIRKARGLSESCSALAAYVGLEMLTLLMTFKKAIYVARSQPDQALGALMVEYENEIEQLKALCEAYQDSSNLKLRAFARELLNDWEIIIRPIHDPSLPLTNNDAERILRHWVIDRRLSNGTRTAEGTRSFTILASVIETCRIRGAPAWDYLTQVITAARKGIQLPALPIMQV